MSLILVSGLILLKVALTLLKVGVDFKLTYIALVGCAPVLLYRFFWKKRRFHILRRIDWFTLVFFAAMFVLMESVWNTGFFQGLISRLSLDIKSIGVILILGVAVSQLISNVPMVALFLPLLISADPGVEQFMALAAGSTIAGNLFILGAASNIIIIQHAEKENAGESLTFVEFAEGRSAAYGNEHGRCTGFFLCICNGTGKALFPPVGRSFFSQKGFSLIAFFTFTITPGNEADRESAWIKVRG